MSGAAGALRRTIGALRPGGSDTRRVLVLQGERAIWTLWQGGRCAAVHVEPLDGDAAVGCRCPWPASGETFVDVVADSPLDDVERVLADENGRVTGAFPRWRLRRRLARRHPEAAVRSASPDAWPLLGSLLTFELPASWLQRLEALQHGAVTIASLHSALRLREPIDADRVGDVLHVVRGAGVERHLLFRSGCPTFTRAVVAAEPTDSRAALDETLAHLATRHDVHAPREVHGPGSSGDLRSSGDVAGEHVAAAELDDAVRLADRVANAGRALPARARSALLDKRRRHVELRRLHAATMLTATIAGLTVLASAAHGIDSARRRAHAIAADEALSLRIERLLEAADEHHATPALADASLALLERHEAARAPSARDVLVLLAGVLTSHPAVRLDRLEWATPEEPDAIGDGRVEPAANQPLRRVRQEGAADEPVIAWLELAGRIDAAGALSVGERQRRFEAFVAALEASAAVTGLRVRLSPASAAATRNDGTGARASTEYGLQMRYAGFP